jgi:DNA repair protein RadC
MQAFEVEVIDRAIAILDSHLKEKGILFDSPEAVRSFLRLQLEREEHEVFGVLFLDTKHRMIEFARMFEGTINAAAVYPREVVKKGLQLNSAAVVICHNHPSGDSTPSSADRHLTVRLKDALALVEIRLLDHFVVGHGEMTSFSEMGLI